MGRETMPLVDLYSNRNSKNRDVWTYDSVPDVLRVQVSNIIRGALGTVQPYSDESAGPMYQYIHRAVAHEHGRDTLTGESDSLLDVHDCVRHEPDVAVWLDVVELAFRFVERVRRDYDEHRRYISGIELPAHKALEGLNERFRRAGFGYRYEKGKIFRIDSEFTHREITRPALTLLTDPRFSGADEEFRAAHDHYKAGEFKDCAVDALNALESTMKAVCEAKKWSYTKGVRASDLLKVLRRENLFPEFADQSFEQLLATLKSGLPVLRNETGGHGQGATPVGIPRYVASYALNLAAPKIRFLVEAFTESEKIAAVGCGRGELNPPSAVR
jgi:hypothetical protein